MPPLRRHHDTIPICPPRTVTATPSFNPLSFVQSSLIQILMGCNHDTVYGISYTPNLILTSGIRCTGNVTLILPDGTRTHGTVVGFDEYSGVGVISTTTTLIPITQLAPIPNILDDIASIDSLVWPGIVGGYEDNIITGIRMIIQTPTATPSIGSPAVTTQGIVGIVVQVDPVGIIPIGDALRIANRIQEGDNIVYISLGVSLIESNNTLIVAKVLPSVTDIQVGDTIVSINGVAVHRKQDISLTGFPVTLVIKRTGSNITVIITPFISYPVTYPPCGSCCI